MEKNLREELYKIIEYEPDDSTQLSIAKEIIDRLNRHLPLNSTEIASQAFTSKPSVTRFAQSLGFLGFKEFGQELIKQNNEYILKLEVMNYDTSFNEHNFLIANFLEYFKMQKDSFISITQEIKLAKKIFIFSSYENLHLSNNFANNLRALDLNVFFHSSNQMSLLNSIEKDDLLIFIVSGFDNKNLITTWNYFNEKNKTVLIATPFQYSLFKNPDYEIDLKIGGNFALREQLKQFFISYVFDQIMNLLVYSNKKYLEKTSQTKFWNIL